MNVMNKLAYIDYGVILGYVSIIIGIGFYFLKRQKSTADYYIANKRIPGWAMGMALMATLISNITFLANPGVAFSGNWVQYTNSLMVIVLMFPITYLIIPFYRKILGMSLYEFFEKRFGYGIRAYGAISFMLYYISRLGIIFFVLSLAINTMTGWNIYILIITLGIITIIYTLSGGIEAVTWTEVVQGVLMISGGLVCLGIALFCTYVDPKMIVSEAFETGKFNLGEPSFNLQRDTIFVMLLYGLYQHFHNFATDQTMVQRYLTAKTTQQAVRGALISGIACVPVWGLFFFLGTALWGFYKFSGHSLPQEVMENADRVFPYFIMTQLPSGIKGLVLAALLSSAMSTLSGGLNSCSTVFIKDIYTKLRPEDSDKKRLNAGRFTVFFIGLLSLLLACWLIKQSGSVLVIYYSALSIFAGGLVGLVLLAFFYKKANIFGVSMGIISTIIIVSWASLTKNGIIDIGIFNYNLHPYLIGLLGHIAMFVFGYGASFIYSRNYKKKHIILKKVN